jgi:hypothetical protein
MLLPARDIRAAVREASPKEAVVTGMLVDNPARAIQIRVTTA